MFFDFISISHFLIYIGTLAQTILLQNFFCGIASQLSLCSIWKFWFRSWFNLSRLAFRFLPSIDATNRGRDRRRAPAFRQMQLSAKLVICLNSEQCSWIQIFDSRFFDWGRNRGKVQRQVQDSRGAFCTPHANHTASHINNGGMWVSPDKKLTHLGAMGIGDTIF